MERISKAPIVDAFKALQIDSLKAVKRLEENGILIKKAETLGDIWTKNETNIMEVFDLITENQD